MVSVAGCLVVIMGVRAFFAELIFVNKLIGGSFRDGNSGIYNNGIKGVFASGGGIVLACSGSNANAPVGLVGIGDKRTAHWA